MGDRITKGQLLLTMDLDKIKAAGHPAVVITVVTNTDDYAMWSWSPPVRSSPVPT